MANCTIASTRGYDEFIPKQLSVITETRPYPLYKSSKSDNIVNLGGNTKIVIGYSCEATDKVNSVQVKGE